MLGLWLMTHLSPTQRCGEQELLIPRHTDDVILFAMEKNANSANRPLLYSPKKPALLWSPLPAPSENCPLSKYSLLVKTQTKLPSYLEVDMRIPPCGLMFSWLTVTS